VVLRVIAFVLFSDPETPEDGAVQQAKEKRTRRHIISVEFLRSE
jgi:hypothetical protein